MPVPVRQFDAQPVPPSSSDAGKYAMMVADSLLRRVSLKGGEGGAKLSEAESALEISGGESHGVGVLTRLYTTGRRLARVR